MAVCCMYSLAVVFFCPREELHITQCRDTLPAAPLTVRPRTRHDGNLQPMRPFHSPRHNAASKQHQPQERYQAPPRPTSSRDLLKYSYRQTERQTDKSTQHLNSR
jgi:hypothetical protein